MFVPGELLSCLFERGWYGDGWLCCMMDASDDMIAVVPNASTNY